MRVLICGDRNWQDAKKIRDRISQLPSDTTVIHGAARGADRFAGHFATERGLTVESFPAEWQSYGRAAGAIRNREMLNTKPDLVIAFHSNLAESKGTRDCVTEAGRRGITVEVIL